MSDKKQEVPMTEQEKIAATVKSVVGELVPALLAMQGPKTAPKAAPVFVDTITKCNDCGQLVAACKGEHVQIAVFPKVHLQYADYFQGVFINGVRYLSNNGGHKITVPANSAGHIEYMTRLAEEEEIALRNPRVKQHNSGDVGRPAPFNPATDGFR